MLLDFHVNAVIQKLNAVVSNLKPAHAIRLFPLLGLDLLAVEVHILLTIYYLKVLQGVVVAGGGHVVVVVIIDPMVQCKQLLLERQT